MAVGQEAQVKLEQQVLRARRADLVVRHLGNETIVYDTRTDEAHLLNPTVALVWAAVADGPSVEHVISSLPGDPATQEATAWEAIAELQRANLLDFPVQ